LNFISVGFWTDRGELFQDWNIFEREILKMSRTGYFPRDRHAFLLSRRLIQVDNYCRLAGPVMCAWASQPLLLLCNKASDYLAGATAPPR